MNPAAPCVNAELAGSGCSTCPKVVMDGAGVPIMFSKTGDVGTIVSISGNEKTRRFLNELGFTPGAGIKVVSQSGGNLILEVKGAKIAIDRTMAGKIQFRPTS